MSQQNSQKPKPSVSAALPAAATSPARLRAFRLIAATVVPAIFFLIIEGSLRLAGVGFPTAFVISDEVQGRPVYRDNPRFAERFFPPPLYRSPHPFVLPREKPAQLFRIVVLGESAAMGDPEPAFGFGRVLERLLRNAYPDRRFEVLNAGVTAINSHAVRDIAKDCTVLAPDLFLVYMGNNEVVGPYGVGTVLSPVFKSQALIRGQLFAKRFRLGQVATRARQWAGDASAVPEHWTGMEMFVGHEVRATDPGLTAVYEHFRDNLEDILAIGKRSGARVLVSTIATSLKDSPPFASKHRPDLAPADEPKWDTEVATGAKLEGLGRPAEALSAYGRAAEIDDQYAELPYRQARALYALQRFDEARGLFVKARDLDALRFRADSRINEIIREVAAPGRGDDLLFMDAEAALARQSPSGILGEEMLSEHVHLSFEGNYAIAKEALRALRPLLGEPSRSEPLSIEACAQQVGLTPWHRAKLAREMLDRFLRPPFSGQLGTKEREARWAARLKEIRTAAPPMAQMAKDLAVVAATDSSWQTHQMLAQLLEVAGRLPEATTEWQTVVAAIPHSIEVRSFLANALFRMGRTTESLAQADEMRRLRPEAPEAYNNRGAVLASQRQWGEAEASYREALVRDPGSHEALINLGMTLSVQKRMDEARSYYQQAAARKVYTAEQKYQLGLFASAVGLEAEALGQAKAALEADPEHAGAWDLVTQAFRETRQGAEAVQFFSEWATRDPRNAWAHRSLGHFLQALGRPEESVDHYRKALAIDPRMAGVHAQLSHVLEGQGKMPQAIAVLESAVAAMPDAAEPYQALAAAYMRVPDPGRSVAVYRKIRERWPNDWVATANLAWNLAAAPDRRYRNGTEAVALAEEACRATAYREGQALNALAAAYAESGRFPEAAETAKKAAELAAAAGKQELAAGISGLAGLYSQGHSYPDAKEGAALKAKAGRPPS